MTNPVTNKSYFEKTIFETCCFCFNLQTGSLIIAILELITGIFWLVGGVMKGNIAFICLVTILLLFGSGILTIIAISKKEAEFLWWAVYLNIGAIIWRLIFIVLMLVHRFWYLALAGFLDFVLVLYFTSILRSCAFEIDSSGSAAKKINV